VIKETVNQSAHKYSNDRICQYFLILHWCRLHLLWQ